MNVYLLLEAEVRAGVFEHEFVKVSGRTDAEKQELVNAFVADLVDDGFIDFKADYIIDFDLFETADRVTLNGNLHVSEVYGVGEH